MKSSKEDFIYHKRQTVADEGETQYEWYLIHKKKRNGTHFHGHKGSKSLVCLSNRFGFYTFGIEIHSKEPIYKNHTPVTNCFVTGGDCYCTGTSLGASESLGHVDPENCDRDVWAVLRSYYRDYFESEDQS